MKNYRPFTLVLPYYINAGILRRQYSDIAALPEDVRKYLHLIVCDDGSPTAPAFPPEHDLGIASFQLFRVDIDVRWNWLTCRNIGAEHARTDWILFTDIDHLLPEITARRIIEGKLNPENVYRFERRDAPHLTEYKRHPNTWLMTKAKYDEIGGYDERFSGYYGTDGEFRDRVREHAERVRILEEYLIRVPREVIPDASTTTYGRKEEQDGIGVGRVRAEIAKQGGPTLRLSFPYHRVA